MSEIKKEIIKLQEGVEYTPGCEEYVIRECNTGADIVRFLVQQLGYEDTKYLIDNYDEIK